MKKLRLIFIVIAIGGCVGHRASVNNSFNSADACKIVEQKKRAIYLQAKREERKNQKRQHYTNSSPKSSPVRIADVVASNPHKPVIANNPDQSSKSVAELFEKIKQTKEINDFGVVAKSAVAKPAMKKAIAIQQTVNDKSTEPRSTNTAVIQKFQQNAKAIILLALAGMAGMVFFKACEKKMQNLSRWGMKNPGIARVFIGGAQTVAALGGLALGHSLYSGGVEIPDFAYLASLTAFTGAGAFYPNSYAAKSIPTFTYFRRKMHDMTLYTTGAMMMTYAGNHYDITSRPLENEKLMYSIVLPGGTSHHLSLTKKSFNPYAGKTPKKDPKRSERIGATIGVSILFTLLTMGVAVLSCAIACAGNGGLSVIVLIGGEGLVFAGLAAIIRSIWGINKKKKGARDAPKP